MTSEIKELEKDYNSKKLILDSLVELTKRNPGRFKKTGGNLDERIDELKSEIREITVRITELAVKESK